MKSRRLINSQEAVTLFDRAVQERALAVLTFQDGHDWQTFKSRFLERDPRGRFFVLDYVPLEAETLPSLAPGQYVGISFRQKSHKLLFSTVVEARGHYVLNDQTQVPAIRYRWPQAVTELQRRAYFRTPVPPELRLTVKLWSGGVAARQTAVDKLPEEIEGELADLSCGGALVRPHASGTSLLANDQSLGVELQLPDGRPPLILDARYRGGREGEEGAGIALQFIGLELSLDGSVGLERLASSVQRLHELGLATSRRGWHQAN